MIKVHNSIENIEITQQTVMSISSMCNREGVDVTKWYDYNEYRQYKNIQTVIDILLHS